MGLLLQNSHAHTYCLYRGQLHNDGYTGQFCLNLILRWQLIPPTAIGTFNTFYYSPLAMLAICTCAKTNTHKNRKQPQLSTTAMPDCPIRILA